MNKEDIMKAFLILFLSLTILFSQDLTTPEYVHAPLLLKVVKEDAAVMKSVSDIYTIAIVYNSDESESEENRDRMKSLFEEQKILLENDGININVIDVEFKSKGRFYAEMDNKKAHLVYICSDVNEDMVRKIKFVSENLNIITITGAEDVYDAGASVTVRINDNDIPKLMIKKDRLEKERKAVALDYLNTANLNYE